MRALRRRDPRTYRTEARQVLESQWAALCDQAALSEVDREGFWHRQFLNPYATEGY